MPDTKISNLTELTTPLNGDLLPIVDTSGVYTTKKIQKSNLLTKFSLVVAKSGTGGADYICDGTADDVQIQAALDAVDSAGGGRVFVRAGTYEITAILTMGSNTFLEGESQKVLLQVKTGSTISAVVKAISKTNIKVSNLRIDGQSQAGTQTGIYFTGCSKGIINDNYVENISLSTGTGVGIAADGASTYIQVFNNYVNHCKDYGINFNNCSYSSINNNEVNDGGHHGIGLTNGCDYCSINDNIVYFTVGVDAVAGDGIVVRKDSAGDSIGNVVANNILKGSDKTLVYVGMVIDATTNLHVLGNMIYSASNGIIFTNSPDKTVIIGNTFTDINSTVITGTNTNTLWGHNIGYTTHNFVDTLNLTVADGANYEALSVNNNDVTNNPVTSEINNAGTNHLLYLNQTGVLGGAKNALTVYSNAVQSNGQLLVVFQDNASSNAGAVEIQNDGTGKSLWIVHNGTAGAAVTIDNAGSGTDITAPNFTLTNGVVNLTGFGQNFNFPYLAKSANYNIAVTDAKIMATSGTANVTLTLPTAVGYAGRMFTVKKVDNGSGTITLNTTSSQTIDGSLTAPIKVQNVSLDVMSDGSNWNVV